MNSNTNLMPAPGDMHASLKYAENKLYILVKTRGAVRKDVLVDAEKAYERVRETLGRVYETPDFAVRCERQAAGIALLRDALQCLINEAEIHQSNDACRVFDDECAAAIYQAKKALASTTPEGSLTI